MTVKMRLESNVNVWLRCNGGAGGDEGMIYLLLQHERLLKGAHVQGADRACVGW